MGSDSFNIDGPCESVSYNWSSTPTSRSTTSTGSAVRRRHRLRLGHQQRHLTADNLQDMFPYAAELKVYYDGYLNSFESQMAFVDNFTTFGPRLRGRRAGLRVRCAPVREALRQDQHLVQQRAEQNLRTTPKGRATGPTVTQGCLAALREHRRLVGPGRRRHGDPPGNHRDVLRHQLDGRHGVLLLRQRPPTGAGATT